MVCLELAGGLTALYAYDRAGEPLPAALAAALPPWRRERLDRLKNENARQESLDAGLLYVYAMRRAGLDPDAPVTLLPQGKPVRGDVCFSLSHSGRYILCAVSASPVGADVEKIRPARLSLARRFHPAERAALEALPPEAQNAALFRLWTRKEAWVKAVSAERFLSLAEADVRKDLPGLSFRDYTLPGDYAAAVCGRAPLPETIAPVSRAELLAAME